MRAGISPRTTLTIDEDVLRWVKIRAARLGKADSVVIEESLRRVVWHRVAFPQPVEQIQPDEATALAVDAQHKTRPKRR